MPAADTILRFGLVAAVAYDVTEVSKVASVSGTSFLPLTTNVFDQ